MVRRDHHSKTHRERIAHEQLGSARRASVAVGIDQQNWRALRSLVAEALRRLDAGDVAAADYQRRIDALDREIEAAEKTASGRDALVQLSLLYYRAGRFADCVRAAGDAVRLRPGYAAAYKQSDGGIQRHAALG